MKKYFEFPDGIIVEMQGEPAISQENIQKAGIGSFISEKAEQTFSSVIGKIIRANINSINAAIERSDENKFSEIELSFGITANAEINNFVVGKLGGECNYSVTITWKAK